jgi:uncharacterized protein YjdB
MYKKYKGDKKMKRNNKILVFIFLLLFSIGFSSTASAAGSTWNPNDKSTGFILSNNNMTAGSASAVGGIRSTNFKTSGKWYWEVIVSDIGSVMALGVANDSTSLITDTALNLNDQFTYSSNGKIYPGAIGYALSYWSGDTVGIALDIDAKKISFYKNNVLQGERTLPTWTKYYPFYANMSSSAMSKVTAKFGPAGFQYTPPVGFMPFDYVESASISLSVYNLDLIVGESKTINATIVSDNTTNKNIIWTTSDPTIATVDQNGKVTGIKEGQTTITAKVENTNLTATCEVNVTNPVEINKNRAILSISLVNGAIKEYDVSMQEVDKFINWFEERANGNGLALYSFTKKINPYKSVKEYIVHYKIASFEVREYEVTE